MYMLLKEVRRPIHVFLDEHATGLRKIAAYEPLDAAERRRVPLEVAWQPNVGGASQHYELLMPVDASDKAAALAASQAGGKASEGAGKAGEGAGNDKGARAAKGKGKGAGKGTGTGARQARVRSLDPKCKPSPSPLSPATGPGTHIVIPSVYVTTASILHDFFIMIDTL